MDFQSFATGIIVLSALAVTARRLIRFFSVPPGKCDGCTGCALKEIKTARRR